MSSRGVKKVLFDKKALNQDSYRLRLPPTILHHHRRVAKPFPSSEANRLARQLAINAAAEWHLEVMESDDELEELIDDVSGLRMGSVTTEAMQDDAAPIRVGTDCSGMDIPILALRHIGVPFAHQFSCDNDPIVKDFIMQNFPAKIFFDDVKGRDYEKHAEVVKNLDLYVAGFPCQSFSIVGF